jgi:hypothetical protein
VVDDSDVVVVVDVVDGGNTEPTGRTDDDMMVVMIFQKMNGCRSYPYQSRKTAGKRHMTSHCIGKPDSF